MKKKVVLTIFIVLLILLLAYLLSINLLRKIKYTNDSILFWKIEGWGPCPASEGCWQNTTLYYSGKLILNGDENNETILDKTILDNIKSNIEFTGIMNKNCSAEVVMDYWASYEINYAGDTKKINFPECQKELSKIEAVFK